MALQTQQTAQTVTDTVVIASGETESTEFVMGGRGVVKIAIPTIDVGTLTFKVKVAKGDTAQVLKNPTTGATITVASSTGGFTATIPQLSGYYSFTIVAATQNSDRTFNISATGENATPFDSSAGGGVTGFAAPALTLGTANTAGSATTVIATNSTILAFDGTVPTTISSGASAATGSAAVAARRDHTHGAPTLATAPTTRYKSGTQTVSATTSFADVSAASGNFAFAIAANEVWQVQFVLPLSFTSTGGAKFQLTGPASPTAVSIFSLVPLYSDPTTPMQVSKPEPAVSGFSTAFANYGAGNNSAGLYNTNAVGLNSSLVVNATIANGANAGTVTLQIAQNSGSGTAVIGVGASMIAQKVA